MEFKELAAKRYSCRKFSDKPVDKKLIQRIITTALLAPTAVNKQPYKIFWMQSEAAKEAIRKVTSYTFGADEFLVVGYDESLAWTRKADKMNFACVDASIAATHLMLEIEAVGLATTWVGYFDAPQLQVLCPEMAGYGLIAIFPIGYAAADAQPSPKHFLRNSAEEMTKIL